MENNSEPIARKENIVIQQTDSETLIYDLKTNQAFCLNETSALVWKLCDGNRTVSDISDEMSKKMKTLISVDFVWLALSQLNKDGLLANNGEVNNHFSGLSRREVIRKVGFATVVALPVISSLVAPKAMMAQSSGLGLFAPCTSDPQCTSLNCIPVIGPTTGITCCAGAVVGNPGGNAFSTGSVVAGPMAGTCHNDAAACTATAAPLCCSGAANFTAGGSGCPGVTGPCVCT